MHRIFGIETEYGIEVQGKGAGDLMEESMLLVRSFRGPHVTGWNYRGEDPRRDMRGFTVDRLTTNPDDAQFDPPGRPAVSSAEERSDRVLSNGARLYNDHGHPEYSTPECASLRDLVAHDKAGEKIIWECAQRRMDVLRYPITIYKNNTDFHGASYGTHECYLMRRDVPPDAVIAGLIPFLVSRQVFAGAGKVGVEADRDQPIFQLSQRADFFNVEASVDTLHNRPLVNTRDEPHATPSRYRRLHVIIGDANMSEWATAMKVGTTALVIALLEKGWTPRIELRYPTLALKQISRDQTLKWEVEQANSRPITAVSIQRLYLEEAQARLAGSSADADWTLSEWERVLDDLERDPLSTGDRVDWAAKRRLLVQFMEAESLTWSDPYLQSLDLAYHDLDPETGLYAGLEQAGEMRRIITDARADAATSCPPADTRAFIRGEFVTRFGAAVRSIGWNGVAFNHAGEDLLFDMNPLVEENVKLLNQEIAEAESLDDVVKVIRRGS